MLVDLIKSEGGSIATFKQGDIIIRVIPHQVTESVYNENLNINKEVERGRVDVFREPVEFISVSNNLIWLKDVVDCPGCRKKHVHKLNLEDFSEGWELFHVPAGLTLEDCAKSNKHDAPDIQSILRRML